MKRALLGIILILIALSLKATHNRAGEITYRQISKYEFEFTVTTFTYSQSIVELSGGRISLEVSWGDNTYSVAQRQLHVILPDQYYHNTYIVRHTFPGPGIYEIVMQDPNRNQGVVNIPNSVNVVFSIKTTMVINPVLGTNNTPVLLNFPIDKAALNRKFIHNPSAFDIDGDSISYKLTKCTRENGVTIENYTFPAASDTLYVNPVTGDLIWESPEKIGIYNIAMNIEEWRQGIKINNIVRDMQVEVYESENNPPENLPQKDLCVLAGDTIELNITSIDQDNDSLIHLFTGGPFEISESPATFKTATSKKGSITSTFTWITNCNQVRKQPYAVLVKSQDLNSDIKLVDIDNFNIRIMAPGPKNIQAVPGNNTISLSWDKSECSKVSGYEIYRSSSSITDVTDSCAGGIRSGLGYELAGTLSGIDQTHFVDNNKGVGLNLGINYCYRIVAIFPDGAKSYPSEEACTTLIPGNPSLLNASVTKVDETNGEVYVSWAKPLKLDTIPALGPYEYIISRAKNLAGNNFEIINTYQTANLLDTFFIDKGLNTNIYPYLYKVELFNNETNNRFQIGTAEVASTMYPDLLPGDNQVQIKFARNVPWLNNRYTIYRQNKVTLNFDSVGTTDTELYTDSGLANGQQVCYRVKSYGFRNLNGVLFSNSNWSHIACTAPIDTTKPCAPSLQVESICDSSVNILKWNNPNKSCANDVVSYTLFYKNQLNTDRMDTLAKIPNSDADTIVYRHISQETLAACYYVTAIDSFGNESLPSTIVCIDKCAGYALPNVFSPNGDNMNDIFKSYNPNNYVKTVNMKIFNRWGKLVYKTENPDINWDGRDIDSKKFVPTGIYYYICDVFEPRLTGIEPRNITGFIHVYYGNEAKPFVE